MSVRIIRDALPLDVAEDARAIFLATRFDHAPFGDPAQFGRTFDGGFGIPERDEVYQTSFRTARLPDLTGPLLDMLGPLIGRSDAVVYCYKLEAGDHLRLHKDDYAGHTGFVWHLSKGWKWDWGGLMIAVDGENASATLPVFNTLVVLDHSKGLPHLVTQVAPWAKEPRMMVTGILR